MRYSGHAMAERERMKIARGREAEKEIDRLVKRIVKQFHPHKIILFGSYARGTVGPDSDVDLLVIMSITGSKRKTATSIDCALADRRVPLDIIVATPEEVERDRDAIGTVIRPALLEGKVVYERAA